MAQTTLMTAVAKQTDIPQQAPQSALQPAPTQESTAAHVENKEVLAFVAEMEKQNQGYCYHHVQAMPEAKVDGSVVLHTHVEHVKQMPGGLLGGVYGCGYGFDLDDTGKWFAQVCQRKEQDMRMPFKDFRALTRRKVEHHEEYYFYRLIKAENYRVFIDRLALDVRKRSRTTAARLRALRADDGTADYYVSFGDRVFEVVKSWSHKHVVVKPLSIAVNGYGKWFVGSS